MALRPRHYQLDVWKAAMRLVRQVYDLSDQLPEKERFGLQAQMRRSAISVPSNIAEGAARGSPGEYARFLQIARSSLMELDTQLWLCQDLKFANYEASLRTQMEQLFVKINALIRSKQRKKRDA